MALRATIASIADAIRAELSVHATQQGVFVDNLIEACHPKGTHPSEKTRDAHEGIDMLNRDGAMALARRLQNYWHEQVYPTARFWAEPIEERFARVGTYEIYRVVCNLVNGLPPRYRDEKIGAARQYFRC
jgi:hypothetical protein